MPISTSAHPPDTFLDKLLAPLEETLHAAHDLLDSARSTIEHATSFIDTFERGVGITRDALHAYSELFHHDAPIGGTHPPAPAPPAPPAHDANPAANPPANGTVDDPPAVPPTTAAQAKGAGDAAHGGGTTGTPGKSKGNEEMDLRTLMKIIQNEASLIEGRFKMTLDQGNALKQQTQGLYQLHSDQMKRQANRNYAHIAADWKF